MQGLKEQREWFFCHRLDLLSALWLPCKAIKLRPKVGTLQWGSLLLSESHAPHSHTKMTKKTKVKKIKKIKLSKFKPQLHALTLCQTSKLVFFSFFSFFSFFGHFLWGAWPHGRVYRPMAAPGANGGEIWEKGLKSVSFSQKKLKYKPSCVSTRCKVYSSCSFDFFEVAIA